MRTGNSIVHLPLVLGIALSISAHAAALYFRGAGEPAKPMMDSGRTVVQLTLIPSAATIAKSEPAAESVVAPTPEPHIEPEPIPVPAPEPVVEYAPERAAEPPKKAELETTPEPAAVESVEQNASVIEDKGVIIEAQATHGIQPTYPRSAQKRGYEGTVLLSIQVLSDGTAGKVEILKSSGHKQLDSAAVKAATTANYTPAEKGDRAVDSELIQPVTFKLN